MKIPRLRCPLVPLGAPLVPPWCPFALFQGTDSSFSWECQRCSSFESCSSRCTSAWRMTSSRVQVMYTCRVMPCVLHCNDPNALNPSDVLGESSCASSRFFFSSCSGAKDWKKSYTFSLRLPLSFHFPSTFLPLFHSFTLFTLSLADVTFQKVGRLWHSAKAPGTLPPSSSWAAS